jgi:hypothetical protein
MSHASVTCALAVSRPDAISRTCEGKGVVCLRRAHPGCSPRKVFDKPVGPAAVRPSFGRTWDRVCAFTVLRGGTAPGAERRSAAPPQRSADPVGSAAPLWPRHGPPATAERLSSTSLGSRERPTPASRPARRGSRPPAGRPVEPGRSPQPRKGRTAVGRCSRLLSRFLLAS